MARRGPLAVNFGLAVPDWFLRLLSTEDRVIAALGVIVLGYIVLGAVLARSRGARPPHDSPDDSPAETAAREG